MIYLIDFENVHEDGFASLGRLGEKDAVYCFFTKNVAKISMSKVDMDTIILCSGFCFCQFAVANV